MRWSASWFCHKRLLQVVCDFETFEEAIEAASPGGSIVDKEEPDWSAFWGADEALNITQEVQKDKKQKLFRQITNKQQEIEL